MNANTEIEQLSGSNLFKEYAHAYSTTTGMTLAFSPLETFELPFRGKDCENAFCALMSKKSRSCGGCLEMQDKLMRNAPEKSATAVCVHGLCEGVVPVRMGERVIGFLQTGQVLVESPTSEKVEKIIASAREMGIEETDETLREAYVQTPVLAVEKFQSTLKILSVFAELLSIKSNQVAITQSNSEPPVVSKAKAIIEERYTEELSLGSVAKEVHVSPYYLCKLFRKTGVTFTEFVSRIRMEKAKGLLLNPNLRITEIVYEVGFQSLTHFSRIFKKLMGESPTSYRARIPGHRNAPVSLQKSLRMECKRRVRPHHA